MSAYTICVGGVAAGSFSSQSLAERHINKFSSSIGARIKKVDRPLQPTHQKRNTTSQLGNYFASDYRPPKMLKPGDFRL